MLSSHSNILSDQSSGIDGLTVTALKTGTSTVTIASDSSTIKGAIKSFIDDYNRAQSTIDSLTSSSTDSSGKVTRSTLAGDSDANEIASKLRSIAFNQATGLTGTLSSLAKIGIDTTGDNDLLKLEDESALDDAIANNLAGLKLLFNDPTTPLVGASAGIFGIMFAAARLAPNTQVLLFFVIPMKLRTLAILLLGWAIWTIVRAGNNAGGEAAHLGGAIAGWYFIGNTHHLHGFFDFLGQYDPTSRVAKARVAARRGSAASAEINRILDKITAQGLHSLTEAEKRTLRAASRARR